MKADWLTVKFRNSGCLITSCLADLSGNEKEVLEFHFAMRDLSVSTPGSASFASLILKDIFRNMHI